MRKSQREGQVLLGVIAVFLVLSILVPLMVLYVQREAAWTVKQSRNTTAFHLAEAGVAKAYAALAVSSGAWETVQAGLPLPDYAFDKAYSDLGGGTYAVSITSGPAPDEATILSVARDASRRESRALRAVYAKSLVLAAVYGNGVSLSGNGSVAWGPIMSRASLTLSGSAAVCWPQKFAAGSISTSGGPCHGTWTAPPSPCTDGIEWWAYDCAHVPPPPDFDFASYKKEAKAATGCPPGGTPPGSCYYTGSPNFVNQVFASSKTVYVEGNLNVNNGFLWGNVIVMGNLSYAGNAAGGYTIPDAFSPQGVTPAAWEQYQRIDTAAGDEYWGDDGFQTVSSSFTFGWAAAPSVGQNLPLPNARLGTSSKVTTRGFVYCGGTFSGAGSTVIHGVLYSPKAVASGVGQNTIFFDDVVAQNIRYATYRLNRLRWEDVNLPWPAGL